MLRLFIYSESKLKYGANDYSDESLESHRGRWWSGGVQRKW